MAVFRWGVAGAAIATGISQVVGGVLPLVYFLRPNSSLLRMTRTKLELRPILQASGNGASELVSNVTASVVGMLYNFQLLRLAGQNGVAAYGVLMYVEFIFAAVFIGILGRYILPVDPPSAARPSSAIISARATIAS